ncbi:M10 family metallopeptidase C-terminal domain-containing protein [Okeania sp. SIO2C2]|uniref:M10 family metallopeptidase C-terminal domain-containing protein n=1 Tax=Okeania sp. SIO2C2 TaxID=2607787 RepID=UPI00257BF9C5|nr:hypothetical protein [Okeania sp. SIO2C2]
MLRRSLYLTKLYKQPLNGDGGDDILIGGSSNDNMNAGSGNDILIGGSGRDKLVGADGNDILNGGSGCGFLEGGNGNDLFILGNTEGVDIITDFQIGADKILLSDLAFTDLTLTESSGSTLLEVTATGERIAILNRATGLTSADFF